MRPPVQLQYPEIYIANIEFKTITVDISLNLA